MTALKRYLILPLLLACLAALAGNPTTNNPNPEPGPTEARQHLEAFQAEAKARAEAKAHAATPQQLESVKAAGATNAPHAAPQPPALEKKELEQKAVAIILRKVWAIQTSKAVILVADPRYLPDLTNIYPSQLIEKLVLEER